MSPNIVLKLTIIYEFVGNDNPLAIGMCHNSSVTADLLVF